jgi:hypothetical protein
VSGEEPDLGEAAEYILAEREGLEEDHVWAVLRELGQPPAPGADRLALEYLKRAVPEVSRRHAKLILREWREYASLARERDWEPDELE